MIQEKRYTGKEGYTIVGFSAGGMWNRRDAEHEGCRKARGTALQERREAGQEGFRTGRMQKKRDSRQEGGRKGGFRI